ncbi:MAG: ammonium transporter [Clostridiaceae bacterium]|jgi:Amt family ammonium transporter|nr:ammonium transporter [Clostridiaceae bacterium]
MYSSADTIWLLIAAALVFFMQAGFAMVEAGLTRAKNTGNIIMKNLMDFAIGTVLFWFFGFGLMFGTSLGGVIGTPDFFALKDNYAAGYPSMAFLIFQTVFCATAATIVSGAMAERTKFIGYIIYSAGISLVVYPISGHWIWGGGWLAQLGFHDFAGSTVVHMVGGVAALIGSKILGPRIGKYGKDGKPKAILGHNMAMVALGVFILWFGWFGFNGGSTLGADGDGAILSMSSVFVTTNLAAAAAAIAAMVVTWIKYKKPDVSMTFNGALAGLVAITAGADVVDPFGAFIIGLLAGVLVVFAVEFFDKKLKIDDPVGAISVHGVCGAFGTIMVGLFATKDNGGLFYGGGGKLFGVQILGVLVVAVYVAVVMIGLFLLIKKTVGLRVSRTEELAGLDISEHGLATAFAGFAAAPITSDGIEIVSTPVTYGEGLIYDAPAKPVTPAVNEADTGDAPDAEVVSPADVDKNKFTKVSIITKLSKFEELKIALNSIGITGMTVTNVMGCGMQKGHVEHYRGAEVDVNLLPKVQVDLVVCKVPVSLVVETANKVLRTGNFGDGKIFVYDVENIVKIRTGEEGYDALQDEDCV